MEKDAFDLRMPQDVASCVVFSSPHSGSVYPTSFLATSRLDSLAVRSSEDAFVDELVASATEFGAPLLSARIARAVVDLNRGPDELDPALIQGVRSHGMNPRIVAGLGVIPRVVGNGQVIRTGKLSLIEVRNRLDRYYHPYHDMLHDLIQMQVSRFGMAIVIDCHSMPHEALGSAPLVSGRKPDIVIGDRFGASADRWVADAVHEIFAEAGYVVARNAPFAGGYITQHYGRPKKSIHAVQIEIDRSLYMDEKHVQKSTQFEAHEKRLQAIVGQIAALGPKRLNIAAE